MIEILKFGVTSSHEIYIHQSLIISHTMWSIKNFKLNKKFVYKHSMIEFLNGDGCLRRTLGTKLI